MAITSLKRDLIGFPHIVRIETTDSSEDIVTEGYWGTQSDIIYELNKGAFVFLDDELALINCSDKKEYYRFNELRDAFDLSIDSSVLTDELENGHIWVGNNKDKADPVVPNGDATIDNTGLITLSENSVSSSTIEDNSINSSNVSETLIKTIEVTITLAQFINSYASSIELIPSPGANKKIVLHRAMMLINYGGTPLLLGGGVRLQFGSDANAGGAVASNIVTAATLIAATSISTLGFTPVNTILATVDTVNKGLFLATADALFTGGTGSSYKLNLWYSVADLS